MLPQWTGNPLWLERKYPQKLRKISGFHEFILCLRYREGWSNAKQGIQLELAHAGQ
jgi:hypothetical protein